MSMDNKVPDIRFKGFSGAWDKKILGDLVKLENGFAFQSKYFKNKPTQVIVLTPGSVNIGGGFKAGKGQYYDEKQEVPSKYVFKPGEMFITMTDLTPTAQALGFPAIIPKDENTYLHNQRLGKLVGFQGDIAFLYNLLRTTIKQKEVVLASSGTTVKHTSPDKFLNRICLFPKKQEQTIIGNYFQKLDSLINQHQQKHDKLNNIKKAMLEKMFPKPGETIPEIRFKGFSGEWEERAFSDIATRVSIHHQSTCLPCVEYEDIVAGEGCLNKDIYQKKIFKAGLKFKAGDILFGKLRPYLKNWFLADFEGLAVGDFWVLRADNVASTFLFSLIQTSKFEYISNLSAGSKMPRSDWGLVSSSCFFVPKDIFESNEIGNYFQKLDTLINLHQQQITKLNNIKQACLSKMFV
ncbi:restriction endonuclease subunit S [Morganella morganii]|uniref:restriction endonuclease subunit S n=1 Tax=Morganella morganii TaxID=582 RepID=UPI00164C25F6|nr:restriction endonuclease subunit S [Morganella morganii]MBC4013062.1 restriction endonuclease subunit S [Morganella morganii]